MKKIPLVITMLLGLTGAALGADVTHDREHLQYWVTTLRKHPLELVRKNAAKMLGSIGDKRVLGELIEALRDPSAAVRQESVHALGLLVDPRAIPAIEAVIERDPDPAVRRKAQGALNMIQKRMEYDKNKREGAV